MNLLSPLSFAASARHILARTVAFSLALVCFNSAVPASEILIPDDLAEDLGQSWKISDEVSQFLVSRMEEDVDGSPALVVQAFDAGHKSANTDISRLVGFMESGRKYLLTFSAKAEQNANIVGFLAGATARHQPIWRQDVRITTEWTEFKFEIKPKNTTDEVMLGFTHLARADNQFSFREIVLREVGSTDFE